MHQRQKLESCTDRCRRAFRSADSVRSAPARRSALVAVAEATVRPAPLRAESLAALGVQRPQEEVPAAPLTAVARSSSQESASSQEMTAAECFRSVGPALRPVAGYSESA